METLIIGKPKIEKLDNRARLCSKISENGKPSYTLWFDVDAKYADYLTESADAFVVALLPYAMNNSLNISAEAKMSKQLCFQLNEIFIPVLTKNSKLFNKISISAKELTQENYCRKNASATGFSRGVDSFDTICSLSENRTEKLSHLTFSMSAPTGVRLITHPNNLPSCTKIVLKLQKNPQKSLICR